jgi:hypothetical protein
VSIESPTHQPRTRSAYDAGFDTARTRGSLSSSFDDQNHRSIVMGRCNIMEDVPFERVRMYIGYEVDCADSGECGNISGKIMENFVGQADNISKHNLNRIDLRLASWRHV